MNDIELCRPGFGYEDLFIVYLDGRVFNLKTERFVGYTKKECGYTFVSDGEKEVRVHILVAKTYPEICGEWFEGAVVDHINGIRNDNRAENLRVCTPKENSNNPITLQRMSDTHKGYKMPEKQKCKIKESLNKPETKEKRSKRMINRPDKSKPVLQFTKNGTFIAEYPSTMEAARRTGICDETIRQCCSPKCINKTAGGFIWKYKQIA